MRIWKGYAEVEETARAVVAAYRVAGAIPSRLRWAVEEQLAAASRGCVLRFYEYLTRECPEAVSVLEGAPRVGQEQTAA